MIAKISSCEHQGPQSRNAGRAYVLLCTPLSTSQMALGNYFPWTPSQLIEQWRQASAIGPHAHERAKAVREPKLGAGLCDTSLIDQPIRTAVTVLMHE